MELKYWAAMRNKHMRVRIQMKHLEHNSFIEILNNTLVVAALSKRFPPETSTYSSSSSID